MQLTLQLYLSGQVVTRDSRFLEYAYEQGAAVGGATGARALSAWAEPEKLFEGLRTDAERLRALPDWLSERGLPQKTFNHPRIALARLDATLKGWGLL